mgnify:CR=1 FL=1
MPDRLNVGLSPDDRTHERVNTAHDAPSIYKQVTQPLVDTIRVSDNVRIVYHPLALYVAGVRRCEYTAPAYPDSSARRAVIYGLTPRRNTDTVRRRYVTDACRAT